jgi:hypothetical protein
MRNGLFQLLGDQAEHDESHRGIEFLVQLMNDQSPEWRRNFLHRMSGCVMACHATGYTRP